MKQESISIVGSGAWGCALAIALSDKFNSIYLIAKDNNEVKQLANKHSALKNTFDKNIIITADIQKIASTQSILITTPSNVFNNILERIIPYISDKTYIAWGTKGFDIKNACFLSQTFAKIMPNHKACVISGPTFAVEIANKEPSAIMVAAKDKNVRDHWQNTIKTKYICAHSTDDVIGVEIGGCIKNIIAIATGMAKGLGFGANTQTVIITKGIKEMTTLGEALGAKTQTLQGLSGVGDLILTCSHILSRNYRFGKELANNTINVKQALKNVGATVEGYNTIELLLDISSKKDIEMPICEAVFAVIEGRKSAQDAILKIISTE